MSRPNTVYIYRESDVFQELNSSRPIRLTADPTALVAQDVDLRGDITLGPGVIVHPKAAILALGGPISIDADCIIEENVLIVNRRKDVMRIGKENHFMIACRIESPSIGDYNAFHPRSTASSAVAVSSFCTLAVGVVLLPLDVQASMANPEVLPDRTVVYGELAERRIWDGSGEAAERDMKARMREYLKEVVPKYNRMRSVAPAAA